MKHKLPIMLLLLGMFLLTQVVGFFVVGMYAPTSGHDLPFGFQINENDAKPGFVGIVFSFVIAFAIIFALMKYKWKFIIKIWFFLVVFLALAISINAFLMGHYVSASMIALTIAFVLAAFKIYRPNVFVHNFTELLIYPGIAALFVPILEPFSIILLLVLISIYDMWAVWKSGIMQKMAKFQMEELNLFGGFLIPSISKKVRDQIKNIKQKYVGKKMPKNVQTKKFKVNLAILGGGDVIFPIIATGVFMRAYGIIPALLVTLGAFVGLTFLFIITKKGKAYPAMPYITTGIFLGMIIGKIFVGF
ncbi:MAG: presenilin family intramembrane aspartyl protease [archaeon]|nr:presenilin family intramembrane aspartyl protease [archaeon]MCR4323678.1 presenilin family intramembrane aspartyl protease [Nanoarchaeota archaeon]